MNLDVSNEKASCKRRPFRDRDSTAKRPTSTTRYNLAMIQSLLLTATFSALLFTTLDHSNNFGIKHAEAISIKPSDFDRLIMPCYLGGGSPASSQYYGSSASQYQSSSSLLAQSGPNQLSGGGGQMSILGQVNPQAGSGYQSGRPSVGQWGSGGGMNGAGMGLSSSSAGMSPNNLQPAYYAADTSRSSGSQTGGFSTLGQQVPRANTMDNFIALVSKIEAANPRLASNPDQLIRVLLGRFRMDNYYYDVYSRTPISEQDHRTLNIIPALLNSMNLGQQPQFMLTSDTFPEHLLDHDEKCSMYFMLSHFVEKTSPTSSPPLPSVPVSQLSGPINGQRPPVLQAAGSGYPVQSANQAYGNGQRYAGPSPSFGSPITKNMNSFGVGLSNDNQDRGMGNNPYGVNSPQVNPQYNQNQFNNNLRNSGYSGSLSKYTSPLIDGGARSRDELRQASEYGVVTLANQDNAAIVLNRVLMGILAGSSAPQSIRQLASIIYPTQALTSTPKIDEEIDPLFAVTLADLWAISAIPKAGKSYDIRLGDNGRWNDTMCPLSFQLERSNSIRFTTAELIGGLDGFSLGSLRRRLLAMRKNLRLSEMLRMYYSRTGFRPTFAEVGVCNRGSIFNTQMDDLHRQSENYLRLYQLNLPTNDNEIATSINRLDSFKDMTRQVAQQFSPAELCQDANFNDVYPMSPQDQCEIAKADVVTVLDTSQQANGAFMNLVVTKLAQKLGLSRQGNSFTVLTNQQDTTGFGGSYSFNAIVRNSTNTAEIGCSLVYDGSKSYQGGQVTDPTRLMEMFERALINLDSEYLTRQSGVSGYSSSSSQTSQSSSYRQSSYVSTLFGGGQSSSDMYLNNGAGPKTTGGAKVIIWFNYGPQPRPQPIGASPTNWNNPSYSDHNQYKFYESKKFLRENFRGASILALGSGREEVKPFVYDEERDIITDIPPGNNGAGSEYYSPASDPSMMASLSGPADQTVTKLIQRMCDIPAVFQYPMCFRAPSEGVTSHGYISPSRKQYWMMSPKTFFASRSVRMLFKVEGGRLRVCFGRMARPDENALYQAPNGDVSPNDRPPGSQMSGPNILSSQTTSINTNNYYTGMEQGICKDVAMNQEIEFIVDDPCYKKPIAECEPFYFVIRETSNAGDMENPNYMCKDEGCKRFDQAKFTLTHSGVLCNSSANLSANWLLMMVSILAALVFSKDTRQISRTVLTSTSRGFLSALAFVSISCCSVIVKQAQAQQAGVHDFGQDRAGEKRGNLTPSEVLAVTMLIMTILAGLALTIGLCYYISKRNSRGMTKVEQNDY